MLNIDKTRFSELDEILKRREIDLGRTNAVLDRLIGDFSEDENVVKQLYYYKISLSDLSGATKNNIIRDNYYWGNAMTYEQAERHLALGN